jgi:predicted DNA-binding protein
MNNESEMVHKRINITLPEEALDKAKRIAEKEDRPLSNVIKRCIEAYKE